MPKYYPHKENNNIHCYLENSKITGFKIKPRNNITYEGIKVSSLLLLNESLIKKVIKRKTKIKLDNYLNFILNVTDDEDDTNPDDICLILDDIKEFRRTIINKYSKFLDRDYIKKILLKSQFAEEELKSRLALYEMNYFNTRKRSR